MIPRTVHVGVCAHAVVSSSLRLHGVWPTRLLCPWNSPAGMLEWVAISFSRGSSRLRDMNLRLWCLLRWQAESLPLSHQRTWAIYQIQREGFLHTRECPQGPHTCCLPRSHLKCKCMNRLKVKGWKKTLHANQPKEGGEPILKLEKLDFKSKKYYKRQIRMLYNHKRFSSPGR